MSRPVQHLQVPPNTKQRKKSPSPVTKNPVLDENWRLFAAQANARLLQVLADLVKAFIDTESEIQSSLSKLGYLNPNGDDANNNSDQTRDVDGVSPSRDDILFSLEDALIPDHRQDKSPILLNPMMLSMTGNQGSQSASPSHSPVHSNASPAATGEGFQEDGDELISRQGDAFLISSFAGDQVPDLSNLNISDDVVLGASRRLRSAVTRILNLLKTVAELQYGSGSSRSGCDSAASSIDIQRNGHCTGCESLRDQLERLQHDLKERELDNRILREKVNEQHVQLCKMKNAIDNTSDLDMKSLKAKNEELLDQLKEAQSLIDFLRESREISRRSKSPDFSSLIHRQLHVDVDHEGLETARKVARSPSRSIQEEESTHFVKSNELLNLDDLNDSFDEYEDHQQFSKDRMDGSGHRSPQVTGKTESGLLREEYQVKLAEKDAEINLLRSQMKLAQGMLSSAFPNNCQNPEDDLVLDVDLIGSLVDSHLQRHNKDDPSLSPSGSNGGAAAETESVVSSYDGLDQTSFLEVQKMDEKMTQLYSMVESLLQTNKRLQKQVDSQQSAKMCLEKTRQEGLKERDSLKDKIKELETQVFSRKLDFERKKREAEEIQQKLQTEHQEVLVLQSTVKVKDEEIASMQKRIDNLIDRIDTLKEEGERRKVIGHKQETEYKSQINLLKDHAKKQHEDITKYEAKISSLLSKIEQLEMDLQNVRFKDHKIKDLELQVRTSKDIIEVKKENIKQLFDSLNKMSQQQATSSEAASREEFSVYKFLIRKLEHDKRCLIFQKNYLTNVLTGFQLTEKATFSILSSLNYPVKRDSCVVTSPLKKFRTLVFAVIAVRRMTLLVDRWSIRRRQGIKAMSRGVTPSTSTTRVKETSSFVNKSKKGILTQSSPHIASSSTSPSSSSSSMSNLASAVTKSRVTDKEFQTLRSQLKTTKSVDDWCQTNFTSH